MGIAAGIGDTHTRVFHICVVAGSKGKRGSSMSSRNKRTLDGEDENQNPDKIKHLKPENNDDEFDEDLEDEDEEFLDSHDDSEDVDDDEEVDDCEDEDEEFDEDFDEEVNVDFEAHDPGECDLNGIRQLLQQLWLKEPIDLIELSKVIVEDSIASVVVANDEQDDSNKNGDTAKNEDKNEEEEEDSVWNIIAIIPFNPPFSEKKCVKQMKEVLLKNLPADSPIRTKLEKEKCALVINERFINLPSTLAVPCYQQLAKELEEKMAKSKDSGYQIDHVLMLSKMVKNENETIYSNEEDEFFAERADAKHCYSVAKQTDMATVDWDGDDNVYEPFRQLLILSKDKWITVAKQLKDLIK